MRSHRLEPVGLNREFLRAAMRANGLSVLLLTSPETVFYTSGFTCLPSAGNPILYMLRNRLPFFCIVTAGAEVTLLCWRFATWEMEFGVDRVIGFDDLQQAIDALRSALTRALAPGDRLGIEPTCPYFVSKIIEDLGVKPRLAVADFVLDEVRLIKNAGEIDCLRRSLSIIEETCGELYGLLRIGMGRNELTREAKTQLMRNGADGVSHVTFSFGLANPEYDIDEPLEPNHLVTLDLGGIYRGYCADSRRYAFAGKVPPALLETYKKMVAIVDAVGAALLPGATYKGLMDLARQLYAQEGLTPLGRFNHVGHHIGVETEERWIDDDENTRVRPGMVINIELYTVASSGDQIGNEETYIVSGSGPTRISQSPREIFEIDVL